MRVTRPAVAAPFLLSVLLGGCFLAAAGAGAGTGIYFTSRGAESLVELPMDGLVARTQAAFTEFGVRPVGENIDHDGDTREFRGTKEDLDVTVKLERKNSGTTQVEVTARRNLVEWDKGFAQTLLARIAAP
ncbi:MAG: hypothetical protein HKM89_02010 [Gemmatimonadales bacterium]|nr:hypothetical protein [Gemmatimonadales bacterium]